MTRSEYMKSWRRRHPDRGKTYDQKRAAERKKLAKTGFKIRFFSTADSGRHEFGAAAERGHSSYSHNGQWKHL